MYHPRTLRALLLLQGSHPTLSLPLMSNNESGAPLASPVQWWWVMLIAQPPLQMLLPHYEGLGSFMCFMCSRLFNWYFDQWMHYKLSL